MTRRHTRFALRDLTFAGIALPGATIDCWEDGAGRKQWSARVVSRTNPAADSGELTGQTADGRMVRGPVVVAARDLGPGGRRETLLEFHGTGELIVDDAPTTPG